MTNGTKKEAKEFGGYGITSAYSADDKKAAAALMNHLVGWIEDWQGTSDFDRCDRNATARLKVGDQFIAIDICTKVWKDGSDFEIWLEAKIGNRVQKQYSADDIGGAVDWILSKMNLITN